MGLLKRLGAVLALLSLVAAGSAAASEAQATAGVQQTQGTLSFVSPSGNGSTGGAQGAAHRPSYLPINPQALAHSKALANERASASAGGRTSLASPAVSEPLAGPSWDGQYETDLAPPDPTGAVGPQQLHRADQSSLRHLRPVGQPGLPGDHAGPDRSPAV